MARRKQHVPWKAAGTASESEHSADDVVRETGWVFNNRTGADLDLQQFVDTGDNEVGSYLRAFGLWDDENAQRTIVEIGSGIGRMTAGFSRTFARTIACDLDAAFLERCRETVAQFGVPSRLQTVHVADGRSVALGDGVADLAFSYITFQHCHHDDALALTREAVRVVVSGGKVALNYRTWTPKDVVLWPAGALVRGLWRLPRVGKVLARQRATARVGWQANRLSPAEVLAAVGAELTNVRLFHSAKRRRFNISGTTDAVFEGVHPSHWWLVADVV